MAGLLLKLLQSLSVHVHENKPYLASESWKSLGQAIATLSVADKQILQRLLKNPVVSARFGAIARAKTAP